MAINGVFTPADLVALHQSFGSPSPVYNLDPRNLQVAAWTIDCDHSISSKDVEEMVVAVYRVGGLRVEEGPKGKEVSKVPGRYLHATDALCVPFPGTTIPVLSEMLDVRRSDDGALLIVVGDPSLVEEARALLGAAPRGDGGDKSGSNP